MWRFLQTFQRWHPSFKTRPHLFFYQTRTHLGGGGIATPLPRHLAPECARASRQRPADSLGHSESNGVRVDLLRSTVDLPGQVKQKIVPFSGTLILSSFSSFFSQFEIERWFCHHRLSLVMANRLIKFVTQKGHLVILTSGQPRSRSGTDLNRSSWI